MAAGHMDRNVVGCLISITASIIQNVGLNVQKEAHKIELVKPAEEQRFYMKIPLWWLGMFGVICGAVGDLAALGLATQSQAVASGGATVLFTN